jgi:hypothetical protein
MLFSHMKTALKILFIFIALVISSWVIAIFWSSHGEWWLQHQSEWTRNMFYFLVRPILSSEVWEAEEQMAFWIFWIPSFIALTFVAILALIIRRKGKGNPPIFNQR